MTGGWYDAGDHGKYVVNGGISLWTLVNQYERQQARGKVAAFADGRARLPKAGNGVNDLLDEARWELEFFLKMQVPEGTLLRVPVGAFLMIRACFNEHDMKARRGACHDEYSYSGKIELTPEAASDLPTLAYVSEANAFPRGVSRMEDSTGKGRLKKSDLVRERDPQCSVSRRFRFDAATGTYQPDAPLPDCSAYTIP